jgi:integrase
VFPGAEGKPIEYHNWRSRVWAPLLKRAEVTGTFHLLRHFLALIQSGVNAKVAQTLAGHHSASFTLDQYADAVPEQLEEAGEKVASVLVAASGSKTVAGPRQLEVVSTQVSD